MDATRSTGKMQMPRWPGRAYVSSVFPALFSVVFQLRLL
jgi:hypothetical protein